MMLHHLFMSLASTIRFARRVIFRFLLVIILIGLNVATVVSDAVYERLNSLIWGAVQLVSEQVAERRPKTRTELNTDLARSKTELEASEASAKASREELTEVRTRARSLEAEAESQKQQLSLEKAHTRQLQADLKAAKAETYQARRNLDISTNRNRSITVELDASNRRVENLTAEINMSKKARSRAVETAAALRSRIVHSIRRDASTEAFEAVPFIGTAVFLGSVAYELNDACNQLRELEALDAFLRGREPEQIGEAMCLLSYEEMVSAITGRDRGYARCVSDRITTGELNPTSCEGYEPAVPQINDSPLLPQDRPVEKFSID